MTDKNLGSVGTEHIRHMQRWINDFVIELNICPFAKREVVNQSIRYEVCDAADDNAWFDRISSELSYLQANPDVETSILIIPSLDTDFEGFLNIAGFAQHINDLQGYSGVFQIAHFHPQYIFTDTASDDPANYTNRAPHAALHLLREASVERAVRAYKNAEDIPTDNIQRLQQLGLQDMQQRFAAIFENSSGG